MPFLLRLLLLALAGISLVGARHASQRTGPPPGGARAALQQPAAAIGVASPRW